MEIDRETWRNSMVGDEDPLYVLERYSQTMRRLYETVLAMAPPGARGRFAQLLGEIEKMDAQCSDFLYEEAGAKLGYRDALSGLVRFDDWPEDLRLDVCDTGVVVRNLPAWMMGYGAKAKFHPLFHKDKRVVYKRQLWRELFDKLKRDYLEVSQHSLSITELSLTPPRCAAILFRFRSQSPRDVQDLDHFTPTLSVVVNALRDNRLIQNDRPNQLSYAVEWEHDVNQSEPVTDLCLRWTNSASGMWNNELWPLSSDMLSKSTHGEPETAVDTSVTIRTLNVREHPL